MHIWTKNYHVIIVTGQRPGIFLGSGPFPHGHKMDWLGRGSQITQTYKCIQPH